MIAFGVVLTRVEAALLTDVAASALWMANGAQREMKSMYESSKENDLLGSVEPELEIRIKSKSFRGSQKSLSAEVLGSARCDRDVY